MSAKLDERILERAQNLRASAVLPKPFSVVDLIESMKRLLG
jgi:hypothetical protein